MAGCKVDVTCRSTSFNWAVSLAVCAVLSVSVVESLKIAAFNIQVFGKSKAGKPEVMETLVRIISRYDIVLIQEIRDSSGEAIQKLLQQTNEQNTNNPYVIEISERLGRTTSKEQYAFFYRPSAGLKVTQRYTYGDPGDRFEREPFVVLFESTSTVMQDYAIAGIHVDPDDAVEEIKALGDVFADIKTRLRVSNVMVMGDFNADCSYVPNKAWKDIPLKHDTAYTWLINDEEDTTVSGTNCAYDRFVVTGEGFSSAMEGGLVPGSADVFKFDAVYGMTTDKADDVSDHYPIELELKETTNGSGNAVAGVITLALGVFSVILMRL